MQNIDQYFDDQAHISDEDIDDVNLDVKPALIKTKTSAADHMHRLQQKASFINN